MRNHRWQFTPLDGTLPEVLYVEAEICFSYKYLAIKFRAGFCCIFRTKSAMIPEQIGHPADAKQPPWEKRWVTG